MREYRARNGATDIQPTLVQEAALTEADVRQVISSMCGKKDTIDQGELHEVKRLKRWIKRPNNWRDAARHVEVFRNAPSTMHYFSDALAHIATSEAKRTTLYRWVRLLNEEKTKKVHHGPIVGMNIETKLRS